MLLLPATIKTRYEIESLKRNWQEDPLWDIYNTEGFEFYRSMLSLWQYEYEAELQRNYDLQRNEQAALLGCSAALLDYIDRLERRVQELEDEREERESRDSFSQTVKLFSRSPVDW